MRCYSKLDTALPITVSLYGVFCQTHYRILVGKTPFCNDFSWLICLNLQVKIPFGEKVDVYLIELWVCMVCNDPCMKECVDLWVLCESLDINGSLFMVDLSCLFATCLSITMCSSYFLCEKVITGCGFLGISYLSIHDHDLNSWNGSTYISVSSS